MINWNRDYCDSFKAKAVTSSADLKIGNTYYTEHETLKITRLLTNKESYAKEGLIWEGNNADELGWFEFKGNSGYAHTRSLHDSNINGGGYNPWLIFADEQDAKDYYEGLKVTYDDDYSWTDHDYYSLDEREFD